MCVYWIKTKLGAIENVVTDGLKAVKEEEKAGGRTGRAGRGGRGGRAGGGETRLTEVRCSPEIQPGQGDGAKRQVPHRPHAQLHTLELQLRLSAGTDGADLVASVEGREGRNRLQSVGDCSPTVDPQCVVSGLSQGEN